jgi:hypothetical protein
VQSGADLEYMPSLLAHYRGTNQELQVLLGSVAPNCIADLVLTVCLSCNSLLRLLVQDVSNVSKGRHISRLVGGNFCISSLMKKVNRRKHP